MASTGESQQPIRCGHCGELVHEQPRRSGEVERVGCRSCGVQVIRRKGEKGEGWQTIRG
ncbi:MAG: hypothetical protein QOG03_1806 [Actinomycetota bacterium]|nr:hypothetical protein [Actinomycetota bacterium]